MSFATVVPSVLTTALSMFGFAAIFFVPKFYFIFERTIFLEKYDSDQLVQTWRKKVRKSDNQKKAKNVFRGLKRLGILFLICSVGWLTALWFYLSSSMYDLAVVIFITFYISYVFPKLFLARYTENDSSKKQSANSHRVFREKFFLVTQSNRQMLGHVTWLGLVMLAPIIVIVGGAILFKLAE